MRLPGLRRLAAAGRRLRSRLLDGAVILGYHRVARADRDPFSLCVDPDHFAQHLEVVRRMAHPVSLDQLARSLEAGRVPRSAVAVTFDDGYLDNLQHAKPMLERYDVPATVHMVAAMPGRVFWWDELAALVPDRRELWRRYQRLLRSGGAARAQVLSELRAGGSGSATDSVRALTVEELLALVEGGLVEIGAHSLTHPILTALPAPEQRHEIERGKAELEAVLGRPVRAFAYPNGAASPVTRSLVQRAGFRWASSSQADVVWRRSDPYRLPRLWVPNVDGGPFAEWLAGWLHG